MCKFRKLKSILLVMYFIAAVIAGTKIFIDGLDKEYEIRLRNNKEHIQYITNIERGYNE